MSAVRVVAELPQSFECNDVRHVGYKPKQSLHGYIVTDEHYLFCTSCIIFCTKSL